VIRVRRIIIGACGEAVGAAATTSYLKATIFVRITTKSDRETRPYIELHPG
jgi:hypothetical protein